MASVHDLKKRIATVKNTQQTTRAMKLVSAAKLKRAQDLIVGNRPYSRKVGELIRLVSSMMEATEVISSPLLRGDETRAGQKPRVLLVLVTSDRGLCGSFNSSIIKRGMQWENEHRDKCASVEFAFVGRRGHEFYKNSGYAPKYYREFGRTIVFGDAKEVSEFAIAAFEKGEYDQIHFVYNEFKNAMVQGVVVERFLPVTSVEVNVSEEKVQANADLYLVKPNHEEVLRRLLAKHFAIQTYRILLESQASEHGARMVAMENATKNAGDMMKSLTLQYNKQRQAGITKELLEIISGAESQNG